MRDDFGLAEALDRAMALETVPTFEMIELEFLDAALRRCGGSKSSAAKLIGMPRRTLQRKLEKLRSVR